MNLSIKDIAKVQALDTLIQASLDRRIKKILTNSLSTHNDLVSLHQSISTLTFTMEHLMDEHFITNGSLDNLDVRRSLNDLSVGTMEIHNVRRGWIANEAKGLVSLHDYYEGKPVPDPDAKKLYQEFAEIMEKENPSIDLLRDFAHIASKDNDADIVIEKLKLENYIRGYSSEFADDREVKNKELMQYQTDEAIIDKMASALLESDLHSKVSNYPSVSITDNANNAIKLSGSRKAAVQLSKICNEPVGLCQLAIQELNKIRVQNGLNEVSKNQEHILKKNFRDNYMKFALNQDERVAESHKEKLLQLVAEPVCTEYPHDKTDSVDFSAKLRRKLSVIIDKKISGRLSKETDKELEF